MAFKTPITELFGMKHPILLAGMGNVSDSDLAAAVCNAGGMGCMGGALMTPEMLRKEIVFLKQELHDKNAPFGIDLLLPQIGGNARKTNHDYSGGNLPELIDIIIEGGAKLFICAVGVPPKWVVDKLHANNIAVMNMVGHVKHVQPCLDVGVDLICAQGGEGGGHTGEIPTSILIPKVVDAVRGTISPLTGEQVQVVSAGGVFDGRGLAMALAAGAAGVWVGTRFLACAEAAAGSYYKDLLLKTGYTDTIRTEIYTGRPARVHATPFVLDWENRRRTEYKEMLANGTVPSPYGSQDKMEDRAFVMGQAAGAIDQIESAREIIEEMVVQAHELLGRANNFRVAKL